MDVFSLGQFLRETRESRGITLEEAVNVLRIRPAILEAFEAGKFSGGRLSDNQARGMLRNYARYLSLDEEHVLRLYNDARQGKRESRWRRRNRDTADANGQSRASPQPMQEIALEDERAGCWSRLIRSCFLLVFSVVALAIIASVTLQLVNTGGLIDPTPTAAPATAGSESPASLPSPMPPTPSSPPSDGAQLSQSGATVRVLVTQRGWIRMARDGVVVYAGIAAPGTVLEYEASSEIRLSGSNALGLDITWNGQRQPVSGGRGQRVDYHFTADALSSVLGPPGAPTPLSPTTRATAIAAMTSAALTPSGTPGPSPTPSASPVPSATWTFTPAPTLTPSDTPLPSATPTITTTATATAILPPRMTQAGLIPPKVSA